MASFAEKVDRWIDALCAGTRVFEDRALDAQTFEREIDAEGPTAEVRRPVHPSTLAATSTSAGTSASALRGGRSTSGVAPA